MIVGIGCYQKYHFIRTVYTQLAALVRKCTSLGCCMNTNDIFHLVIVQTCSINQPIVAVCFHLSSRNRIRFIAEYQILLAWLVCLEADGHYIVRVRNEVITFISYTVFIELYDSQS